MSQTPVQTHVQSPAPTHAQPQPQARLRGRIGAGFSPVPHRYRVFLAADDCPHCRGVAAALAEPGLRDAVAVTVLGSSTDSDSDTRTDSAGHQALRRAYEASGHHHDGPLTVPALCDGWSGRVVSNHTPDILEDLRRLSADPAFRKAS
ncbi:hypothetical protein [Streptomyces sp. NBC_00503]|uniref:hypothetical protein n=1 Tax=Streptomyces sp. NBC_00503 TaxID=2903659 RepID=UPI002E80E4C1|nr:hypothetical protein [Streptomyces sp. NBC_00503]WUD80245.1 hypothetical protein OG490_06565 [Streptomyces sp. NBC_00503]